MTAPVPARRQGAVATVPVTKDGKRQEAATEVAEQTAKTGEIHDVRREPTYPGPGGGFYRK